MSDTSSSAAKTPPFHAEHVGSLLRPKELTAAFKDHRNGAINDDEFTAVQDQAIRDVIKLQEDVGLDLVTDGEFRRPSYWARFVELVDGLSVREASFKFRDDHGHEVDFTAPHVDGPVRRSRSVAGDEYAFTRSVTSKTPKITLPSPPSMHFWRLGVGIDEGLYDNDQAFFDDLAKVYREEIAALAEAGCNYVQLDDVPIAMLCDPTVRAKAAEIGYDPEALMQAYVDLMNSCVRDKPEGMTVGMHLCRGNFKGHYLSEGGYETVAELLFQGINVDAFFLEYDTPRAGDFEALKYVPDHKRVVLGLVSSKNATLENTDGLKSRINDAAKYVDLARLSLSPQCGFASTVAGNPVTVDDEKAKLAMIVGVARDVWG